MIREMWADGWSGRSLLVFLAAMVVLCLLYVASAISFERACDQAGGTVVAAKICVSRDGRILF